jgi:hypothetical protein
MVFNRSSEHILLDHSIKKGKENMKHLFRSRVIQQSTPRYRAATLVAFVAFATLVMMLTTAAAYASTPKTPTAYSTNLTSGTISGTAIPNSASGCNQSVCKCRRSDACARVGTRDNKQSPLD